MNFRNVAVFSIFASCVAPPVNLLEEKVEEPMFTYEDFLDSPYVRVTHVYSNKDARATLIHLRQIHYVNKGLENRLMKDFTSEEKRELIEYYESRYEVINKVQKEIYFFLQGLRQKGVREVLDEGCLEPLFGKRPSDFSLRKYNSIISEIYERGLFREEIDQGKLDGCKYIPGAGLLLDMAGMMKLLPAEEFFLNERAMLSLEVGGGVHQNVHTAREDHVVSLAASSGKSNVFCIYGGGHDFVDNVDSWNRKNPTKKISLIELTPYSFPKPIKAKGH